MKRLYDWACGCAEMLASAALALIAVLNLLFCTVLATDESSMFIARSGLPFLLSLALWAALLWLLAGSRRVRGALSRLRPEAMYALCAGVYVLMAAYLMRNLYQGRIDGDVEAVYYAAKGLRQGDYTGMQMGSYISRYPHQLGLAAAMAAVMSLGDSPAFLRMVNVALVLLTNYAVLRAAMTLPGATRATGNLAVLLAFLIVPQFLLIMYIYGNIPGLCLMLLAALALFAWLRGKSGAYAALAAALMALAYLVRNNMIIACIAMAIICVLAFLRTGKKRMLASAVCMLLCPLLLVQSVQTSLEDRVGLEAGHTMPSSAWMAMGMQEDGNMPGWYNNYNDYVYYTNCYDTAAVSAQALDDIHERLYDFKKDPLMALSFYLRKIISTWCEPTFGSLVMCRIDIEADCATPLLRSLYSGGTAFTVLREAMHGLTTLIYALSALYPWLRRRTGAPRSAYALFAQVFFLGGFFFHILWETKSMYVLCYCVCLVPVAAQSAMMLGALLAARREKKAAPAA